MTNEQREAIDRLNKFKTIEILYGNTFAMHIEQLKTLQVDLDTVLSLIKEQQEEISKYKTLYERALSDVVKTDKQIDLMADEIIMTKPINCTKTNEFSTKKNYMSKEEIKQYFERKVENVEN